jgi:uncharacterized NAD-dependent epimerase/dehydratase family protein
MTPKRRIVILAQGKFSPLKSKTANQALRYIPEEVVGIIDGTQAGKTAQEVVGFGGDVPVFPDLRSSLSRHPDTLLIGIAPTGGRLPESWRAAILEAIDHRLDVISGLHTMLEGDPDFAARAAAQGVRLVDLRKIPHDYEVVSRGSWRGRTAKTILTVGTDCNAGKMTASLELHREFVRRGLSSDFVPTGQTGILLAGKGIAVDSIISDYVAGAIEKEVDNSVRAGFGFIHVEGQGSLTHQGYSAVTLGLMHGVMPDAMIMVHHPARRVDDYGFPLDNVRAFNALHEAVLAPFKRSRVVGIALNSAMMTSEEAALARSSLERELGLPVADVLTPEVAILADALLAFLQQPVAAAY